MNSGLNNLGNTCYMNSIIQCISHLDLIDTNNNEFITEATISKSNNSENFKLMEQWLILNKKLKNNKSTTNPINFLKHFMNSIDNSDYYFMSFMQNDAAEFITIFFDLLHKCIVHKIIFEISGNIENPMDQIAVDSINYWKKFFENGYSTIIKNTYSQLLSITKCPECEYTTYNHDPIQYISLHINKNTSDINITNLFNNYIKEKLDNNNKWKCDVPKFS